MKFFKTRVAVIALCLFSAIAPAKAQLTEGQAGLLGGIIGYAIGKNHAPQPVYAVPPVQYVVPQQPIFIHPSQVQGYNSVDHGYCAVYTNEAYYQCLGNLQRQRNDQAYRRGLQGY